MAKELVGCGLVRFLNGEALGGLVIETEAYLASGDDASHSVRGKTASNASMFGPPGLSYVYPIHSRFCFNVSTGCLHEGQAVLIRAIEPILSVEQMRHRRGGCDHRDITRGPSRLCEAMSIDRRLDGVPLWNDKRIRFVSRPNGFNAEITSTPRIGISKSKDHRLRFIWKGHLGLSGTKRLNTIS